VLKLEWLGCLLTSPSMGYQYLIGASVVLVNDSLYQYYHRRSLVIGTKSRCALKSKEKRLFDVP